MEEEEGIKRSGSSNSEGNRVGRPEDDRPRSLKIPENTGWPGTRSSFRRRGANYDFFYQA